MDRGLSLEPPSEEDAVRGVAGLPAGEALLDVAVGLTGQSVPPAAMRLELVELPLDQIVTDAAERDASAALREELEEDGALRAIDVRARPDGRYDLVDGSRRLDAARALGQATIAAIVEPAEAARLPKDLRALLLNTQRQNLQQLQIGIRARRLIEAEGWSQANLARRLHRSRSALCAALKVAAAPDLVAAIKQEHLAFGAARALVTLSPEERQPLLTELIEQAHQDGRFPSVRAVEALARRGRRPEPPPSSEPESAPALLARLLGAGMPLQVRLQRGRERAATLVIVLPEDDPLAPTAQGQEPGATPSGDSASGEAHGETSSEAPSVMPEPVFPREDAPRDPAGPMLERVAAGEHRNGLFPRENRGAPTPEPNSLSPRANSQTLDAEQSAART